MSEIEKIRMLEGAIVDLVSAIQKGDTTLSDEIDAVDEAVHKFPEWRVEIHPLERSVSAADEAPITIYWRKEPDEKLYYEGMRDFDAAEWKRDELIKAGYTDIQIIVKGKKKEVVR